MKKNNVGIKEFAHIIPEEHVDKFSNAIRIASVLFGNLFFSSHPCYDVSVAASVLAFNLVGNFTKIFFDVQVKLLF